MASKSPTSLWRTVLRWLRFTFLFLLIFIPVPIANLFLVMVKRQKRTESGEVLRRDDRS